MSYFSDPLCSTWVDEDGYAVVRIGINGARSDTQVELSYPVVGNEQYFDVGQVMTVTFTGMPTGVETRWRLRDGSGPWSSTKVIVTASNYPLEKYPNYWPTVTSQWFARYDGYPYSDEAFSCVANALATCIEVHRRRQRGIAEQFSHMWIWGNRYPHHHQGEYMQYAQALNKLVVDGVPAYHDYPHPMGSHRPTRQPQQYWYNSHYGYRAWSNYQSAKELTNDMYSSLISRAEDQRINSYYEEFNTYDTDLMKQYISNTGAVLLPIELSNDFDNMWGADGILTHDATPNGRGGHTLVALGWCLIDGWLYWICQNSWGVNWGDGGICYVPHWYDCAYMSYVFTPRSTTPKLNTPTFIGSSVQGNTITLNYASLYMDGEPDPKPTSWHIRCRLGSSGTGTIVEDKYVSDPSNVVFSGLQGNTTYNFVCNARRDMFAQSDYTDRVVITTESARPPKFSWTHPKVQGGEFNLTATEWNALCNNVNLVEQYKGIGQTSFTPATQGANVLATMFNQVRFAIGSMNATGITNRYAGDPITAAHLNTLVTKLNEIV